jgi:hypothetical protein
MPYPCNGIRVEPDDPLFALVTINRIVLEEATQELQDQIQARFAEFDPSYQTPAAYLRKW